MYYGIEAPNEMTSLVIQDSVRCIGTSAFYGISTLSSLSIGKDINRIGDNAFYDCINLSSIHCSAAIPPTIYSTTFDGVNKFSCILYVPEGSIDMYRNASGWRDFYYIQGITPSAIDSADKEGTDANVYKFFYKGQLYILLSDGTRYDSTGKRVE